MRHGDRVSDDDRTCMTYWFPIVRNVAPVPATEIVTFPGELFSLLDGVLPEGFDSLVEQLQAAGDKFGWPAFLRTGHGSGKHDWRSTCYVADRAEMGRHVAMLVEWSCLVDLPVQVWAVREMLDSQAPFQAFEGMPVARERRWWINDGVVVGHHPYWPRAALEQGRPPPGFEVKLSALNHESEEEVAELGRRTAAVAAVLPGAWSVDWMHTPSRGWVLIDMAAAQRSWVWEGHPTAPSEADRGLAADGL